MCGIAGAFGFIDERVRAGVRRMHDAQIHRGPDGEGVWASIPENEQQGVILAHRRLAIIDLSEAGAQPMHDPATGNVVVYNGEIYNFSEVRSELAALGHEFSSASDTEVILKAYAEWGLDCLAKLRGMFALAIWDGRRQELQLARDRLGIKPLYVSWIMGEAGRRTLLFASELRAMLASGLVERRIDPVGLSTYFWNGFVVGPSTLIRGVEEFPAGSCQSLTHSIVRDIGAGDETPKPARFWRLPAPDGGKVTRNDLRDVLLRSVSSHLVSDVPLGVFLSGGIDSSSLAALASRAAPGAVHTFNIAFEESDYDEAPFAEAVAKALGTEHQTVRLRRSDFASHLTAALASIDQPTFDAINTYFVSKAVREAGVTVALAGTGGDELFGGYRSFEELPRIMAWNRRMAALPAPLLRRLGYSAGRIRSGAVRGFPPQTRWGKLGDVLAARDDLVALYQVSYGLFTEDFLRELAVDTPAAQHGLAPGTADELRALVDGSPALGAISNLELSMFIGQRLLRDTDAASMAVSLEVRVPLLDHAVVEAAAGLSESERYLPLRRKQILRDVALDGLDPGLFERPKSGFVMPFDVWCRDSLKIEMDETLRDARLCERVGLDPGAVARLWDSFLSGSPGLYWSRPWSLFVLLDWCRKQEVSL